MRLPTGLVASFEKSLTFMVVLKALLAAIATIHQMLDNAGISNVEFARHGRHQVIGTGPLCQ